MTICIGTKIATPGVVTANTTWVFFEGEIPGNNSKTSKVAVSELQPDFQPDSQES